MSFVQRCIELGFEIWHSMLLLLLGKRLVLRPVKTLYPNSPVLVPFGIGRCKSEFVDSGRQSVNALGLE